MSKIKALYRCVKCNTKWAWTTGPQLLNPEDGSSPSCFLCNSKYCQWLNYNKMFSGK